MKSKCLQQGAESTHALVLDTGDEVTQCLLDFARAQQLSAAHFTAIGAFSSVVLGYFDWERKDYQRIPLDEQIEVVALMGDVATKDGEPQLHAHVVVSRRDGTAWGGHLLEGRVRPTLEVIVTETPAHLRRESDPKTGLALIKL